VGSDDDDNDNVDDDDDDDDDYYDDDVCVECMTIFIFLWRLLLQGPYRH
jgi:hypothetical protein